MHLHARSGAVIDLWGFQRIAGGGGVQLRGAFSLQFLPAHNDVSTVLRRVEDLKRCSDSCRTPEPSPCCVSSLLILGKLWDLRRFQKGRCSATADPDEASVLISIYAEPKFVFAAQMSWMDRSPEVCSPSGSRAGGAAWRPAGRLQSPDLGEVERIDPFLCFTFRRLQLQSSSSKGNPLEKQRERVVLHLLSS